MHPALQIVSVTIALLSILVSAIVYCKSLNS